MRQRIGRILQRIGELGSAVDGRVIPDEDGLLLGVGRRLPLAVMFLDISGFSARPSYTATEQSVNLQVLNLFFTEMVRIAEDYGGAVEKNTGDGLLAYFEENGGTPPAPAVKRAVACALTMMATNDYFVNPVLRGSGVPELSFRISIDYGPVTIARLGAPRRFNALVAIGTPANFASKMLSNAQPGEIVLGDQAKRKLPLDWQLQFTQLALLHTDWNYSLTGLPYTLYRYTGRWNTLV